MVFLLSVCCDYMAGAGDSALAELAIGKNLSSFTARE
jgi:hypothetical protein